MNIHTNKLKNKDRVDKNLFYLYYKLNEVNKMCIFDYINKHIFGYDPVIKTKPCEKKDNKTDSIVPSSKTKSKIFLKLIDDYLDKISLQDLIEKNYQ